MRSGWWRLCASFVSTLALVSCGSGSRGHHAATGTATGSASTVGSSSLRPNGVASKPPAQILAAASNALHGARTFVVQGTLNQNGKRVDINLASAGGASLDLRLSAVGQTAEIIVLANSSFVRANRSFWTTHVGPNAAQLANRWIQLAPAAARTLTSELLGSLAPSTLARCLSENHGTLTTAGRTQVGGRPAVLLRDAGNAPGSGPGTLAVATSGPPYPLQATSTGRTRPGGRIDVCNDGKGDNTQGVLSFGRFGAVPPIKAPSNAVRPAPGIAM